ncbi:putative acyl-activating enzyme 17 peroxisomal [Zea mays]|uniref:4-coumarate--CoA ligase n=1 Tax=Zea mays TaxID=4577 RepID=A0A1D6IZI3_MAIZE|nr:putative acyl-activating enzyme 17 peroxisomal [Zea mays]
MFNLFQKGEPMALKHNGSLYAHVYFARSGYPVDPTDPKYEQKSSFGRTHPVVAFLPKSKAGKKKSLLGDSEEPEEKAPHNKENKEYEDKDEGLTEYISYFGMVVSIVELWRLRPLWQLAENYTAVNQPAYAFTNILFSSGTTGEPKAIPWTHITPIKAAADGWCHMDIRKGDFVAWPTNLGWTMGPWLVYASLLNGASMALYNGSPNSSGFAKFVQDAKVTMLGLVPSIVRTWKNTDCTARLDWSSIR